MGTMIDIDGPLLERAERFAAGRGKKLADVVNDALIEKLGREERAGSLAAPFRMMTFGQGGPRPGIDLDNGVAVQDVLDDAVRDPSTGAVDLNKLR